MTGSATTPVLVTTKFRPPRLRSELIERENLVQRLREGREHALTLVCAPAGYGKSTLLSQWMETDRAQRPFAWMSLDKSDSDPTRLWAHLIAGIREAHAPTGERSLGALAGGPRTISERVIPHLVQELVDAPGLVVILDDWHLVRNPQCDATMALFVEQAPDAVQIVISTRSDPSLPIARLRAHGALSELRAADLRTSTEEAVELFERADVELSRSDVERLNDRAEGWLAGICLVLLAVKDHEDRQRFVDEFSGNTRHVLDFLAKDVLSAVSPDTRDFLLRTSVLGRLSADLCDAALETSNSAAMLARIAGENLFLVQLDEPGEQYRYHHLFADMLARELQASDPTAAAAIHARASIWLEENADTEGAVEHAIASRDLDRSRELVLRHSQTHYATGHAQTVARWLAALSWPEALADPPLATLRAVMAGMGGQTRDEIERWLAIAESAPDVGPLANGVASVRSATAIVRAMYLTRGPAAAEVAARLALDLEPPSSPWRRQALMSLGQALYLVGRSQEAREALEEARRLSGPGSWASGAALALSYLALIELDSGASVQAERMARGAIILLEENHVASGLAASNPLTALGAALTETTDVLSAVELLSEAVELASPTAPSYWHAHALIRLAAALDRLGDTPQANEALSAARADLEALPEAARLSAMREQTEAALTGRHRRDVFLGEPLSEAELRIVRSLASGASLSDVARELYLSQNTVKTHRRSIYRKLGVSSRDELVTRAAELEIGADGDRPR